MGHLQTYPFIIYMFLLGYSNTVIGMNPVTAYSTAVQRLTT